jgi:hypothetical protein
MPKKSLLTVLFSVIIALNVIAFCGFYVAKADSKLFNKSSQVIITRDGETSTVTMSSDFECDVKEFAMVIPVPTVIKQEDIKVVDRKIFDYLDAYSAPRLAEYFDNNPCNRYNDYKMARKPMAMSSRAESMDMEKIPEAPKVKIEAKYTVGEYDIIILSSTEANALKTWLNENGYKIPAKAEEVLEPYIKSNLKFFVVKVNLGEKEKLGLKELRPIQMTFNTPKFMLPIRLGMANSQSTQDMIIYAFSKKGRVETSNYRTVKIPTDKNVPEFTKEVFGEFYKSLFDRVWKVAKNAIFLEYSWNLSGNNFVKCDPCSTTPPTYAELKDAGVHWATYGSNGGRGGGADYGGDIYFTRLHVRYDRAHFPQDLDFQETPNQENFQGRYIIHNAVKEKMDCKEAEGYIKTVKYRRQDELKELELLTGWSPANYKKYTEEINYTLSKKVKTYESTDDIYQQNIVPRKSKKKKN